MDHVTELIINAATLFSKDLLVDDQLNSLNQIVAAKPPSAIFNNMEQHNNDDDLDLLIFSKLMTKKRMRKQFSNVENHISEINPMDLLEQNDEQPNKRKCKQENDREQHPFVSLSNEMKYQFFQFLKNCDDLTFENHFKLTKKTFINLQITLDPILEQYMRRTEISLTKFQIIITTLWLLTTNESISNIADRFGISKENCQRAFKLMCEAISKNKHHFIKWPSNKKFILIQNEFNNTNSNGDDHCSFPNICGIIGSTSIKVAASKNLPANDENNKKPLVKLQCVCDSTGQFFNCYIEGVEIGSNVSVFNRSPLKSLLERNPYALPSECHFIGDQSYPLRTYLMVPFKEHRRSATMNEYNTNLEAKRKLIDHEFARLIERFARLKFINMKISPELIQCIEMACCFHNFCIQQTDSYYLQIDEDSIVANKEICRDFTMDQRALDKRNRILKKFNN